jgi:hypothetical protein
MIRVFHAKAMTDFFGNGEDPEVSNLVLCAEVDTEDLEKAFELTNHIELNWWGNDGVTFLGGSKRSTSCGDVLELDGKYFVVATAGFRELGRKDYYAQLNYLNKDKLTVVESKKEPEVTSSSCGFKFDTK